MLTEDRMVTFRPKLLLIGENQLFLCQVPTPSLHSQLKNFQWDMLTTKFLS